MSVLATEMGTAIVSSRDGEGSVNARQVRYVTSDDDMRALFPKLRECKTRRGLEIM